MSQKILKTYAVTCEIFNHRNYFHDIILIWLKLTAIPYLTHLILPCTCSLYVRSIIIIRIVLGTYAQLRDIFHEFVDFRHGDFVVSPLIVVFI